MELRVALLLVGLLILAVVVVVSKRRFTLPRLSREVPSRRARSEREPVLTRYADLSVDAASGGEVVLGPDTTLLVDVEEQEEAPLTEPERGGAAVQRAPRDEPDFESHAAREVEERQIDFVARLPGQKVVRRDTALGVYRQNEYLIDKPHRIFGLSHTSGMWRDLEKEPEEGRYTDFALSIQLADRAGPITESELTKFSLLVLRLSEALKRRFKFSMSFEEAQEQGRELDRFCKSYDVLAVVNIVTKAPQGFSGADIDRCARECDMELGGMNIYHRRVRNARGARNLFSMANLFKPGSFQPDAMDAFTTQGLTLFMNMPCTAAPVNAFEQMVEAAKGICEGVNGRLVDQNRRPLTQKGIEAIRQEIVEIARKMEAQGVVPGSDAALRLF